MFRAAGVTVACAAVLAGCGVSKKIVIVTRPLPASSTPSTTTPASSTSTPASTSPTNTATTNTGTTNTSSATATTSTHAVAPGTHHRPSTPTVHLAQFASPSGNIGCIIGSGQARCDIKNRSWSPPPRPPGCPNEVNFGQGMLVNNAGVGHFVCAGDTAIIPGARALPYGTDTLAGGFLCASRTSGMACFDTRTRHGFFIAIQGYRSF